MVQNLLITLIYGKTILFIGNSYNNQIRNNTDRNTHTHTQREREREADVPTSSAY